MNPWSREPVEHRDDRERMLAFVASGRVESPRLIEVARRYFEQRLPSSQVARLLDLPRYQVRRCVRRLRQLMAEAGAST